MSDKQKSVEKVNRKNSGKWRSALGAFVPRYVPNRLVAGIMSLLGILYRTPKGKTASNREHNRKRLPFVSGSYIENQPQWKDVHFGNRSTMSYSGCEIMAVYNALLALGVELDEHRFVELICHFEKHGAVWAGQLGVTPWAIKRYFRKAGYNVSVLYCRREEVVNALGAASDTVIATVYNDARDIFKMIHTVNISKDEVGKVHAHNCYKTNSNNEFISDGPYETLWEAIHRMGQGKSEILCVMGISDKN